MFTKFLYGCMAAVLIVSAVAAKAAETLIYESENVWVTSPSPDATTVNHNKPEYRIGYNASGYAIRTLVRFNIGSLLSDMGSIRKIEYRIYYPADATAKGEYRLYLLDGWEWATITFNGSNTLVAGKEPIFAFTGQTPARNSGGYMVLDLTRLVLDSLAAGKTELCFMLADSVSDLEGLGTNMATQIILRGGFHTNPRAHFAIEHNSQEYYETLNGWIINTLPDYTPVMGVWMNKSEYRCGYNTAGYVVRTLVKFNFSTFTQNEINDIKNVKYNISFNGNINGSYSIYEMMPWSATQTTWNNVSDLIIGEVPGSNFDAKTAGWKNIDITQFVKAKLAEGQSEFDFMIVDHTSDMEGLGNTLTTFITGQSGFSSTKANISFLYKEAKNSFVLTDADSLTVDEDGTMIGQYYISSAYVLGDSNDITLSLTNTDGYLNISPDTISFDSTNYNVPQLVTVTAVDDAIIQEGAYSTAIKHVVSGANAVTGLSFEVNVDIIDNEHKVIDNFESYANNAAITAVWQGGASVESTLVYESAKSMKATSAECGVLVSRLAPFADWTANGWKAMRINFRGNAGNDATELFLTLTDAQGDSQSLSYSAGGIFLQPYSGLSESYTWKAWDIDLADFTEVDLTNVVLMEISTDGTGANTIYLDYICLYIPRYVASQIPEDINSDAVVNEEDLKLFTTQWLDASQTIAPIALSDDGLLAHFTFNDMAYDSVAGYQAVLSDGLNTHWDSSGYNQGCLNFDGAFGLSLPADIFATVTDQITISLWINGDVTAQPARPDVLFHGYRSDASLGRMLLCHCPLPTGITLQAGYTFAKLPYTFDGVEYYPASDSEFEGVWNHYAFVKDASTGILSIYCNGILKAQNTNAYGTLEGITGFALGSYHPAAGGANSYMGKIDELKIYGRALSQAEILNLAGAGSVQLSAPAADINGDGVVDIIDYAALAKLWLNPEIVWPMSR